MRLGRYTQLNPWYRPNRINGLGMGLPGALRLNARHSRQPRDCQDRRGPALEPR